MEDETRVPTGPWTEDDNQDCPEYHTAAFRMYVLKVMPCFKRYCHDWTLCPFAHPGEKARRRDPCTFEYSGVACPDIKKFGSCRRGNACPYAHTIFEYWLHPSRYCTQRCNDGAGCTRRVCFFAHSPQELRTPGSKLVEHTPASRAAAVAVAAGRAPGVPPGVPQSQPQGAAQAPPQPAVQPPGAIRSLVRSPAPPLSPSQPQAATVAVAQLPEPLTEQQQVESGVASTAEAAAQGPSSTGSPERLEDITSVVARETATAGSGGSSHVMKMFSDMLRQDTGEGGPTWVAPAATPRDPALPPLPSAASGQLRRPSQTSWDRTMATFADMQHPTRQSSATSMPLSPQASAASITSLTSELRGPQLPPAVVSTEVPAWTQRPPQHMPPMPVHEPRKRQGRRRGNRPPAAQGPPLFGHGERQHSQPMHRPASHFEQAQELAQALRGLSLPDDLVRLPPAGHGGKYLIPPMQYPLHGQLGPQMWQQAAPGAMAPQGERMHSVPLPPPPPPYQQGGATPRSLDSGQAAAAAAVRAQMSMLYAGQGLPPPPPPPMATHGGYQQPAWGDMPAQEWAGFDPNLARQQLQGYQDPERLGGQYNWPPQLQTHTQQQGMSPYIGQPPQQLAPGHRSGREGAGQEAQPQLTPAQRLAALQAMRGVNSTAEQFHGL